MKLVVNSTENNNPIPQEDSVSPYPGVDSNTEVGGDESAKNKSFKETVKDLPWRYIVPVVVALCAVVLLFTLSWLYGIVGLISGLLFALGMIIPAGWYLYNIGEDSDEEDGEDDDSDDERDEEFPDDEGDEEEDDEFRAAGIDLEGSLAKEDIQEEKSSFIGHLSTGTNVVAFLSVILLSAGVVVLKPLSLNNDGWDIASNSGEESLDGLFDDSPFSEIDDSEFDSLEQELTDQEKQEAEAKKAAQKQRAKEAKEFREKSEKTSKDIDKKIADLKKKREKKELDKRQQAYYDHLQAQRKAAQDAQDAARRAQQEQNEKAWEDYYKRKAEYDKKMKQRNAPQSTRGDDATPRTRSSVQVTPSTAEVKYFASCEEVIEKELELHDGDNGYRPALDKDGNGIACDEEDIIERYAPTTSPIATVQPSR